MIIFHQHFKLPSQAGSSRLFKLVKGLYENGCGITIITGSSCRAGVPLMGLSFIKENLIYKRFEINDKIGVISLLDFYDQKLSFVLRMISFVIFVFFSILFSFRIKKPIDLVFASSTPLSIVIPAIFFAKTRKKPFIFEIRDLWPEAPIQLGVLKNKALIFLSLWLEKFAYKNAVEIIGLSRGICRKIHLKTKKRVTFIPNSVDDDFFKLRKKECSNKKDEYPLKVVYAGSCGYNNAIEVIFSIAKKAMKDRELSSKVIFFIIGDGPALQKLQSDLPGNVKLMGKQPKTRVAELLVNSDIALFSQRKITKGDFKKDGLPNKYFDFIGAALPIVTGAVREGEMAQEITRECSGIVAEPEDVEELYSALKKIVLSPEIRKQMSMASEILSLKYSTDIMIKKFIILFDGVKK